MAMMAGGGGGGYKRPMKKLQKPKKGYHKAGPDWKRPPQANLGQGKRMKPKPLPKFQAPERRLGDEAANQLRDARKRRFNENNPVKGGELKKSPTRRLTPTKKRRVPGWAQQADKLQKGMEKFGKDAGDVWKGKKGYGKNLVDFADEGFSNYLKNKRKKPVRKAPTKKYRKDGPVVGVMKKVKKRNSEIDRWTQ